MDCVSYCRLILLSEYWWIAKAKMKENSEERQRRPLPLSATCAGTEVIGRHADTVCRVWVRMWRYPGTQKCWGKSPRTLCTCSKLCVGEGQCQEPLLSDSVLSEAPCVPCEQCTQGHQSWHQSVPKVYCNTSKTFVLKFVMWTLKYYVFLIFRMNIIFHILNFLFYLVE